MKSGTSAAGTKTVFVSRTQMILVSTDSLDIIQILWIFGYSLVLELVISLYTLSNEDVWHHRHRSHRDNSSHFRPKFDRLGRRQRDFWWWKWARRVSGLHRLQEIHDLPTNGLGVNVGSVCAAHDPRR